MTLLPIPFGNPATYPGHSGVDYPGHAGEAILASGPGSVVSRARTDRGGHFVWVQYDVGPLVGYHHMNSFLGVPALRARVSEGSTLGFVGWDGHVVPPGRAGAHLHSEVAGNLTTAGYWKFFDRNRVVGQGSGAGGGGTPVTPTPPAAKPEQEIDDMDRLMQIDPSVDGNWYVVNYRRGTMARIDNGFQLDRVKEEIVWESKLPNPSIIALSGVQPTQAIANLVLTNPKR